MKTVILMSKIIGTGFVVAITVGVITLVALTVMAGFSANVDPFAVIYVAGLVAAGVSSAIVAINLLRALSGFTDTPVGMQVNLAPSDKEGFLKRMINSSALNADQGEGSQRRTKRAIAAGNTFASRGARWAYM